MKSRTLTCIAAITLFTALTTPVRLGPQERPQRYTVTDLGTLGGTFSSGEGISNRAWVDGFATLPGDTTIHAFLWRNGMMTDIGTPGLNTLAAYPFNERGEVAIQAEVSTPDPLGEDFCGFGTRLGCPPSVWQKGVLTRLPTLGGNNGHANQVNNRGEVAGVAENTTPDQTCMPQACVENICLFQVLQTEPVVWTRGRIRKLPTLPGDPDGIGLVINDHGEVAGTSGQCIGSANEALHAVLWQNGTVTDLGNLGGTTNNHPQYINNQGQVVGYSNLPGDATNHAFLWQKGVMTDLGTLPGDFASFGEAINDVGQVGGFSCDINFNCRAFLWQGGVMSDLNTLIPAGSPLFLLDILSINSRGQIVGDAVEISSGQMHGYLATPSNGAATSGSATTASRGETSQRPTIVLPENLRQVLQSRSRFDRAWLEASRKSAATVTSAPIASLSPSSLSFPAQVLGTTSQAKTVTLKNTGNAGLTITGFAITGSNPGNFAQTHTCGGSLAVGASCTISVKFRPTMVGPRSAALSISDNAAGSPQKVLLSGTGVVSGPNATLSPASLTFADQLVGTTSQAKSVKLTNYGTATLSITSITASGDFSQTHTCGLSLAPLAGCAITVIFKPTQIGVRTGTLSVADNAPGSPQSVALSGTGVVSGPNATLSPTSLTFACKNVPGDGCECITLKTATLSDFGTTTLGITGIGITGAAFSQTNDCDASLGSGKSCTISVKWSPPSSSFSFGTVSVSDNASGSPQTVSLKGQKECTPP